jgi:rod shape-determining protein MreC
MLQRIYDILYEFRVYAILTVLIIVSIVLMALNDNPQVKQIRSISTVIFGLAQEKISFIPTYFGLRSENEILRRNNIELADETQRLREAKLENLRLRQLIGLKDQFSFKLTAARVINKNLTLLRNTLTVNVGSDDSVKLYMPVVSDGGLVGIITNVTEHYSIVNILLNTEFRASAKIQRSRIDGIVMWDGKTLGLKNVPKMRDVKIGDVVMTSEYSNTFPPDIRIGLVSQVIDKPSELFKSITIEPGVDFVKLETVFIAAYPQNKERAELELRTSIKSGK